MFKNRGPAGLLPNFIGHSRRAGNASDVLLPPCPRGHYRFRGCLVFTAIDAVFFVTTRRTAAAKVLLNCSALACSPLFDARFGPLPQPGNVAVLDPIMRLARQVPAAD